MMLKIITDQNETELKLFSTRTNEVFLGLENGQELMNMELTLDDAKELLIMLKDAISEIENNQENE